MHGPFLLVLKKRRRTHRLSRLGELGGLDGIHVLQRRALLRHHHGLQVVGPRGKKHGGAESLDQELQDGGWLRKSRRDETIKKRLGKKLKQRGPSDFIIVAGLPLE